MLAKIKETVSKKPLVEGKLAEALNREIVVVLTKVRDAINGALGDETRISLVNQVLRPVLGTSAVYQEVDHGTSVFTGAVFDPDDYPATSFGRTRNLYFRVVGRMVGASTSVAWQLYDGTAAAPVADAFFQTSSSAADDSGLVGPLTLTSGGHEYIVLAARADGVAEADLLAAELVVRYE